MNWQPTWTQAMTDFRGEDDEPPFDDVTVRMRVPASIGGDRVRLELSNRFGDDPIRIGRAAFGIGDRFLEATFDGRRSTDIPAGEARWSDPIELTVAHDDDLVVDLYLPETTAYTTANGFRFERSLPGDFVGATPFPLEGSAAADIDESREFPAANTGAAPTPDGTGWSLPPGGPFLRTIEVSGAGANAVIVCLGSSSTAMGWPQYAAGLLAPDDRIAVVNRGIAGNRIRLDAPEQTPSWGRAGLTRFDEDVLGTHGVTHLVVAYNSNDFGLPGRVTSLDEMPSVGQLIAAYRELVDRARAAGVATFVATITPLQPELADDDVREGFRREVNEWMRTSGVDCVDFDAAIRSETNPSRLAPEYAAPDDTHPNVNGEKRLAQAMVDAIANLRR